MNLEVGMYVRTQNGLISKIQGINEYSIALKNTYCERLGDKYFTFPNEEKIYEISKSSFNLIDLIEVGDYVNGERVGASRYGLYVGFDEMEEPFMLEDIKIYEVLTHEQYEANCYKLGDDTDE